MKTDAFIQALVQDLTTPVVPVAASLKRVMPLAAVSTAIAFLVSAGLRPDLLASGLKPTAIKVGLGLLLAVGGLLAAVRLARPDAAIARSAPLLLLGPAFALMAVAAELVTGGAGTWQSRLWSHSFLVCLMVLPLLAALPLIAALYALRHGASTHLEAVGAVAGLGAAGIAIVTYGLFCNEDSALFIATWYLLATCIVCLIGAVAGRVVLRW